MRNISRILKKNLFEGINGLNLFLFSPFFVIQVYLVGGRVLLLAMVVRARAVHHAAK
jgi:hypothetical protein